MQKVGIIGGAGFIGSYITKEFLNHNFSVLASTTDSSNESKYKHLKSFENAENLEILELDVRNRTALQHFVKDCDIVIHSGTPFQLNVEDPQKDLFDPTIRGTEVFLDVIAATPSLKKVIFIASVAAWNTNFPFPPASNGFEDTFDETNERFTSTESHPYCQAKFIANQIVEKFIQTHQDLKTEIISISPVMVMGKSLSDREDSTSSGFQFLLKNKIIPDDFMQVLFDQDMPLAIVDVEDVAKATFQASQKSGLHGKDYLLTSETYKVSDIHELLNLRDSKAEPKVIYGNTLSKTELGISYRPVRETLSAYSS